MKLNSVWLAVLSGVLLGLSFPPVPFPFFIFFAFVPYFFELEKRDSLLSINKLTYIFAFIVNIITLYWVGSWSKETDKFLMISGAVLLFFNPLLFLIPSTVYYMATKIISKRNSLFLLPFFWIFYEYLYTVTDFRFPWLTLGNTLAYFTSFIQISDIIGVSGLGVIILFVNIFIYRIIKQHFESRSINLRYSIALAVFILLPLIYGFYKISSYDEPERKINVGLIQPNLNPWNKWEAGSTQTQLDLYLNLSEKALKNGAQILFFPETALPIYLLDGQHYNIVKRIKDFSDTNKVTILTGMPHLIYYYGKKNFPKGSKPTQSPEISYKSYNSVLKITPNSNIIDYYGKIMLVPFGEKVPLIEYIPALDELFKWEVGISSWNVGEDTVVFKSGIRNGKEIDSVKIGTVVCIESIYSQFISSFVLKGAEFIAVVTNDSWYGNSSGPYQHQAISLLRAVENRRYVVRAANGGISCIINPLGQTLKESKMFTKDVITGEVGLINNVTFYTKFPNLITGISVFISLLVIAIIFLLKLKKILKIKD